MISIEQFNLNSDRLLRRYLDDMGFIHTDFSDSSVESSLIYIHTIRYIKEYLKILKDILKDTYSEDKKVIDEKILLNWLIDIQDNVVIDEDKEKSVAVFIAIKKLQAIINSARIN